MVLRMVWKALQVCGCRLQEKLWVCFTPACSSSLWDKSGCAARTLAFKLLQLPIRAGRALPSYKHSFSCFTCYCAAAVGCLQALEGADQRSSTYHSLVLELLQEAERTAHKPAPRLVFMACMGRLLPRLGLYVVRHLAALMPLLLEWVHAYDEQSSVVALQLLALLVRCAWPRMGVHAGVVRRHVEQVIQQELVEQGARSNKSQLVTLPELCRHEVQGGGGADTLRARVGQQLLQLLDSL